MGKHAHVWFPVVGEFDANILLKSSEWTLIPWICDCGERKIVKYSSL